MNRCKPHSKVVGLFFIAMSAAWSLSSFQGSAITDYVNNVKARAQKK